MMKRSVRRNLIGMTLGAVIVCGSLGSLAYAHGRGQSGAMPPHVTEMRADHGHPAVQMNADEQAKYVARTFGVSETEVKAELDKKTDLYDVGYAAMLAKISGKGFADILGMKTAEKDWTTVAAELGVTQEQIQEQVDEMVVMHVMMRGAVDEDTARALLGEGYRPHDIEAAGLIARAAQKDVRTVLAEKEDGKTWEAVAAAFGVDASVLPPSGHGHGMKK